MNLKLSSVRSLQYLREIPVCLSSKVMTVGAERQFWFNGSDCAEGVQEAAQVVFRGCEAHMAIDIARGIEIQRPPWLFLLFSALPTAWNQVGSLPKTKCIFGWCDVCYNHYLERWNTSKGDDAMLTFVHPSNFRCLMQGYSWRCWDQWQLNPCSRPTQSSHSWRTHK